VELGRLIAMLKSSEHKSLGKFLQAEFSRVGSKTAAEIIERADGGLTRRSYARRVAKKQAGALYRAIQKTKISAPASDCVVPIGEELLLEGLKKEVEAELYVAVCRPPAVYRGNPFVVEVGLAYGRPGVGHELDDDGRVVKLQSPRATVEDLLSHAGEPVSLLRFANRVPLLFQQGACVMTKAVIDANWRSYGLTQSKGALPQAPMVLLLHIASVWVPFTSESKEAVAAYSEIHHELLLALREAGRRLRSHVKKQRRLAREFERRTHIERYLPHVGRALEEILGIDENRRDVAVAELERTLQRLRKV
jgi:DNA topoisomerase-6 subunit B